MLKGKETRPHPPIVSKEDMIDVPEELLIKEKELAADD